MRIAINCRLWLPNRLEGIGHFTQEIVSRWIKDHPEHDFILLFDRKTELNFSDHSNVEIKELFPQARHPWLYKVWFEWSLPLALRKEEIDLFFSPEEFCSMGLNVPTVITIHDLAYLNYPSSMRRREVKYRKRYVPRFLEKCSAIVTVSKFSKNNIFRFFPELNKEVAVIHNGCRDIFRPLKQEEKEQFRKEKTNGQPYFFYYGSLNPRKNIVNLMHAYTQFRSLTGLGHKLVLGGKKGWKTRKMQTVYDRHPNKKDIIFTGYLNDDEILRWLGSSESLVYVSKFEGFGLPVLEAMKCGTSVVTTKGSSMEEVAADAAYYANAEHPGSIANAMRNVVVNEEVKNEKIDLGLKRAGQFSWDKTSEKIWEVINKLIKKY